MSEQIKTKKKLSIGKVWVIVCVAAVLLGLAVSYVGFLSPSMEEYNNHEHEEWCYIWDDWNCEEVLDCYYSEYDSAFSYAMERDNSLIILVGGALVLSNVVMGIIYATRKPKASANSQAESAASQTEAAAPVSIPMGEGEQTVLSRCYAALFPIVLLVLGVLSALIGLIILMDDDETGIPLLIVGIVFAVVGARLRKVLKIHLVVTTKRVYLKAPFACRVNLPLNRISAVGTGLFHYLQITSAAGFAGQIRLFFVPKYLEVYDTINTLLNEAE